MNEEEVKELYQKEGYVLLDEYKGKRKYNTVEKMDINLEYIWKIGCVDIDLT